jgi:hypothetical protein
MKYRIVERRWYDNHGKIESQNYIIQVRKSYLGIKMWRTITVTECNYDECYSTAKKFSSFEKAQDYIENDLCKTVKPRFVQTVVTEVPCK